MTVVGPDPKPRCFALARVIACAALLAGCAAPKASIPAYVSPSSGPTARFLVRGSVPAGDRYGVFVLQKSETCAGPLLVGTGDAQRHPDASALAANSVQTVEFRLVSADKKTCAIRWTFTPIAGKTYLLRGTGQQTSCGALIMDMTDADHMKPEPTALRRNPGTSACLPISQSKSIASRGGAGAADDDAVLRQGADAGDLEGLIGK